jgi:hypothetical protein
MSTEQPDRSLQYRWYLTGCSRLDREPLPLDEFSVIWQEYENYAELLKQADRDKKIDALDASERIRMERKIQADPILKAVLVGQAEEGTDS